MIIDFRFIRLRVFINPSVQAPVRLRYTKSKIKDMYLVEFSRVKPLLKRYELFVMLTIVGAILEQLSIVYLPKFKTGSNKKDMQR